MTEEEINKTLAEFMGWFYFHEQKIISDQKKGLEWASVGPCYTRSLDALVPVVEKLGADYLDFEISKDDVVATLIEHQDVQGDWHKWDKVARGKTMSLALATSCAEVIREIKE